MKSGKFYSVITCTLTDYDGEIAFSIYYHNCNLRCPYCYNLHIIGKEGEFSFDDIVRMIDERREMLTAVCLVGGEPTIDPNFPELINMAKERGLKVKVFTNGTFPERVFTTTDKIDFISVDIKGNREIYRKFCGNPTLGDQYFRKVRVFLEKASGSGVEFEIHFPVDKHVFEEFIRDRDGFINDIGFLLSGIRKSVPLKVKGVLKPGKTPKMKELMELGKAISRIYPEENIFVIHYATAEGEYLR